MASAALSAVRLELFLRPTYATLDHSCAHIHVGSERSSFLAGQGIRTVRPPCRPSSSLHALFPEFEVRWRRLL